MQCMKININVEKDSELEVQDMEHIGRQIADGYEKGEDDPKPGINWEVENW